MLRDRLGIHSAKDGCSPQGQCGCCTVLVDGAPRVACVTPARRVAGRAVTTLEGLDPAEQTRWAEAFCAAGASQCGFCTPGIVVRLAALAATKPSAGRAEVDQALLAHLCRCTGWQTIGEAFALATAGASPGIVGGRDLARRRQAGRAGGRHRAAGRPRPSALGQGGFADDTAPADALVAVLAADGSWVVGDDAVARRGPRPARCRAAASTVALTWPLEVPPGDWARTLRTTWVEPAYLEPDSSWCVPGGEPATPLANGGAFGGKLASPLPAVARGWPTGTAAPCGSLASREDVVRLGPKRPPLAAGVRADGTGVVRVARTAGIAAAIASVAPGLEIEEVDVAGPPTSAGLRAAGWAEAAVLLVSRSATTTRSGRRTAPRRAPRIAPDGSVAVTVRCGRPLDDVVLRSYCIGAAHMASGWVRSEGSPSTSEGEPLDLTIRSFGILRAVDMPHVEVTIEPDDTEPVNGSDAVFAAVAAAAWRALGHPPAWPANRAR